MFWAIPREVACLFTFITYFQSIFSTWQIESAKKNHNLIFFPKMGFSTTMIRRDFVEAQLIEHLDD
jgi:hypothetical protein